MHENVTNIQEQIKTSFFFKYLRKWTILEGICYVCVSIVTDSSLLKIKESAKV